MDQREYIISFDGISVAEANIYAEELRNMLLDASEEVKVERKRDDPSTQDFGATLALILGTPAVVAVAKALGEFLMMRRRGGITIKTTKGEIIGTNLTSKDILKIVEIMLEKQ